MSLSQSLLTVILIVVAFLCVIGLILIGVWLIKKRSSITKKGRITHFVASSSKKNFEESPRDFTKFSKQKFGKFRDWVNGALSNLSSEKLQLKLSSAYWAITDTEYLLIRIIGTVSAFLFGWLILNNFVIGVVLLVIAIMLPSIILDRAIIQRQNKFHDQLLDVLVLINGAVQAGYSLMQALDVAVREIPAPASEEFGRIISETRLGISLEDALINLSERMKSNDLQIVVTAVIINSQVGGNLSRVLDSAISTIRDRMHLSGEIRSLTSYSRWVGNFLSFLPFIAALAIYLLSPGYFDTVKTSLLTQIIFIVALVGVVIGNIWIRQIVKIKV